MKHLISAFEGPPPSVGHGAAGFHVTPLAAACERTFRSRRTHGREQTPPASSLEVCAFSRTGRRNGSVSFDRGRAYTHATRFRTVRTGAVRAQRLGTNNGTMDAENGTRGPRRSPPRLRLRTVESSGRCVAFEKHIITKSRRRRRRPSQKNIRVASPSRRACPAPERLIELIRNKQMVSDIF